MVLIQMLLLLLELEQVIELFHASLSYLGWRDFVLVFEAVFDRGNFFMWSGTSSEYNSRLCLALSAW